MIEEIRTPDFSRANSQNQSIEGENCNIFDYSQKKLHKKKTPDWNIANLQLKHQVIKEENENVEIEQIDESTLKNDQKGIYPLDFSGEKLDNHNKTNSLNIQDFDTQLYSFGRNKYEQYENTAQILEIQKFNSKQNFEIYSNYTQLLDFYRNNQKNVFQKSKVSYNQTIRLTIQTFQILQNLKQSVEQVKKNLFNNQKFSQDKIIQNKLIQFGYEFNLTPKNKMQEEMLQIEKMILAKENISFELKKLFSAIFNKQPPQNFKNKDLLNLMKKHVQNNQKFKNSNVSQQQIKDSTEIDDLQNIIKEYQFKEKILQQDKDNLKEMVEDMKQSYTMQNEEIEQLKKKFMQLQNQKNYIEQKKMEEDSTLQSNQDQNIYDQDFNDMQQQMQLLFNSFSILFYLKTNYSCIQISDIKNNFFQKPTNVFLQNNELINLEEFFRQHLQQFLNIDLYQKDSKDIKLLLKDILKETGLQKVNMYQGSENSQQCGQDINVQKNDESSKQNELLQELQILLEQEKQKNNTLIEQQQKLLKSTEDFQKQVNYLKNTNQKLRLKNLQMIKLKKKFSQQQHELDSLQKLVQKTTKRNWGTQTLKQKIEISNDFDILLQKKLQQQYRHQRQSLQRQDSLTMFKKITIFHKKIEHYKSIIKELQQKLNDNRPLVSPRLNFDEIHFQLNYKQQHLKLEKNFQVTNFINSK